MQAADVDCYSQLVCCVHPRAAVGYGHHLFCVWNVILIRMMMDNKVSSEDDYQPSLRVCTVTRPLEGSCGFHLSRTTWDPYPWVSEVESGSAAEIAGLQVGDCVLEVNGEDVLGQRIGEVALQVYSKSRQVKLLLWNAGTDSNGTIWLSGGSGPTPLSLQRLAVCLQSVVQLLECPVCLETSSPPSFQCCNGHLLCGDCRGHADRCPVCRVPLGSKGRCLLADKLYSLLTSTFLRECHPKKRKGIFRNKGIPRLKLKSRLPKQSEDQDIIKINEISLIKNRLLSSADKVPESSYYCPCGECDKTVAVDDLIQHIQSSHEGPLIQYFPKSNVTTLRLPLSGITTINCHGLKFFVHVVPHKTVGCLLFWLWVAGEADIAELYNFFLNFPGLTTRYSGIVFPLTMSENEIILSPVSEHCLILDNIDMDSIDTVSVTISIKNDNDVIVDKTEE
ncbi:uncharacterized protein LOC142325279 [Lycorma delicatula]|uniref:uncharacterized protein LOC142325279 n=1 Tax=Lycorma delicatula TaxID=130591 RepID=UPI003F515015